MKATKVIIQSHRCTEINDLMKEFRFMVNEAIRVGFEKNITSKLKLRNELYPRFKNGFHTSYINIAVFKVHALLKNYRRQLKKYPHITRPYVKKQFLIVDSQYYRMIYGHIQIPRKPREFLVIPLTPYVVKIISQDGLKLGNAIINPTTLALSYSKDVNVIKIGGYISIDRNLDNITCYDTDKQITIFDTSSITKMKDKYSQVKSHFTRNDVRIQKKIFEKYGTKQRNKENQFLHKISKQLTSQNKGIILEDLKGIRKHYRKGNGKGKKFRNKMNLWSFYKLGKQLTYKILWNYRIPVIEANPQGTSMKCSICDAKVIEENRYVTCPKCGYKSDRDVNAARNILSRGMRFVPDAVQGEAMRQLKDVEQIAPSLVIGEYDG